MKPTIQSTRRTIATYHKIFIVNPAPNRMSVSRRTTSRGPKLFVPSI